VKQHDTNWPYLTTRETLRYASELYNIVDRGEATNLLVQDIITKMGLHSCADTKVARLSGGQQRRLSLAIALLKQPSVLFLDEPTSGLDAASAAAIMREITRVAKEEGIIMVCTIHQPSSKVYNGFDQVMILSKGRLAFVGNANAASDHFDSIGYPLPPMTNPAEHFLDLVNADFSSSREVDAMLNKWVEKTAQKNDDVAKTRKSMMERTENNQLDGKFKHNLMREIQVMFRRHILLMGRDPILYAGRFMGFLIVNCVFGIVYIAARGYTQDQAVNKLWVSAWYIGTCIFK
jgi:ABC-type multidrug transport system ATPase subunit